MSDSTTAPDVEAPDQLAVMQQAIDQAVATGQPVDLGRGKYALFATPEGGLHLAYRPDGVDQDGHLPIPPGLLRLALAKDAGLGGIAQIKSLFGL